MKTTISGIAVVAAASVALCRASTAAADEAGRLNAQGFKLLKVCAGEQKDRNAFVSPYSIDSAFGLLWLGSEGESKRQIEETLGFPADAASWLGRANESLADGGAAEFLASNSAWIDESFSISSRYLDALKLHFKATPQSFDCRKPGESAGRINAFVAKNTSDMIKDVLSPGSITPDTGLILVNTLYFDGKWAIPFESEDTWRNSPFFVSGERISDVDKLCDRRTLPYAEDDTCQAIRLDYKGDRFSYVAILPKKGHDENEIVDRLSSDGELARLLSSFRARDTRILIPRMALDFKTSLKGPLQEMGMRRPFERSRDFAQIGEGESGRYVEKVGDVVHATRIEIDEEGTRAAAATAIVLQCAGAIDPEPYKIFHANRPHVGIIYDRKTGLVLFCGVVRNPGRNLRPAEGREPDYATEYCSSDYESDF